MPPFHGFLKLQIQAKAAQCLQASVPLPRRTIRRGEAHAAATAQGKEVFNFGDHDWT
jgi:hypothetical protein